MTKDEFFQLVASQGIEEAFRQLPAHHDIELLQMRVQNLRQDFMEGLISVHTAIMDKVGQPQPNQNSYVDFCSYCYNGV